LPETYHADKVAFEDRPPGIIFKNTIANNHRFDCTEEMEMGQPNPSKGAEKLDPHPPML
jgi:hypothetical protein